MKHKRYEEGYSESSYFFATVEYTMEFKRRETFQQKMIIGKYS